MKHKKPEKEIIEQPTETSPDAAPKLLCAGIETPLTNEQIEDPNFKQDFLNRTLDEAELTPEQKNRYQQIGVLPSPRATDKKFVVHHFPASETSPFVIILERIRQENEKASKLPFSVLNPPEDPRPMTTAALERRALASESIARGMRLAMQNVGDAARGAMTIFQKMNKIARVDTGALLPSVNVKISVGERRYKSERNDREKSLKSGFPLAEKNLSVLRAFKADMLKNQTIDDIAGRGMRAGELMVLAGRPAFGYVSPLLRIAQDIGERIKTAYIKLFLNLTRPAAIEKAKEITGFGEKRLEKEFKRIKNKAIRDGRPFCLAAQIWAQVCINALSRKAQKRIGSNIDFIKSETFKHTGF